MAICTKLFRQGTARKSRTFRCSSGCEIHYIEALKSLSRRHNHIRRERYFRRPRTPAFAIKLHFIHFVIEQRRAFEWNQVFCGDALYDFWRIEKPVAVVLPERNIVREVLGDTITNGKYINDLRRFNPVRPTGDILRHIPSRYHFVFTRSVCRWLRNIPPAPDRCTTSSPAPLARAYLARPDGLHLRRLRGRGR